ncbi:MAG: hypothetical protein IKG89_04355, partial [Oscillospiraceae bacterium]|nr:hypothetical protein [Oscillospiraceae bacterium]
ILGRNSFLPQNTAIAASVEVYDRGAQRRCHPSQLGAQRSGSELKRVDKVDTLSRLRHSPQAAALMQSKRIPQGLAPAVLD